MLSGKLCDVERSALESSPQKTREKDCYQFADLVSILANATPSHTNVEFEELWWGRFSGVSDEFGSDGFKPQFQDYSGTRNQARHYIGGLQAGFLGNPLGGANFGSTVANAVRETTVVAVPTSIGGTVVPFPVILPPTASQKADRALNKVSGRQSFLQMLCTGESSGGDSVSVLL